MGTIVDSTGGRRSEPAGWSVPLSLVLSVLYVGIHFVIYVPSIITSVERSDTVYATDPAFGPVSFLTGVLLLAYLGLDFWRWRVRGSGGRVYDLVFGGTAVLLLAMLFFLWSTLTGF